MTKNHLRHHRNVDKNHNEIPTRVAQIKKADNTKWWCCCWRCGTTATLTRNCVWGPVKWHRHFAEVLGSLLKVKHIYTLQPSKSIPRYFLREIRTCPQKDFTRIFIAALLQIALNQKQPNYPLTAECISKLWYIHTMEQYCSIKKNESLVNAITWIKCKHITLSERPDKNRVHIVWFNLHKVQI